MHGPKSGDAFPPSGMDKYTSGIYTRANAEANKRVFQTHQRNIRLGNDAACEQTCCAAAWRPFQKLKNE